MLGPGDVKVDFIESSVCNAGFLDEFRVQKYPFEKFHLIDQCYSFDVFYD